METLAQEDFVGIVDEPTKEEVVSIVDEPTHDAEPTQEDFVGFMYEPMEVVDAPPQDVVLLTQEFVVAIVDEPTQEDVVGNVDAPPQETQEDVVVQIVRIVDESTQDVVGVETLPQEEVLRLVDKSTYLNPCHTLRFRRTTAADRARKELDKKRNEQRSKNEISLLPKQKMD